MPSPPKSVHLIPLPHATVLATWFAGQLELAALSHPPWSQMEKRTRPVLGSITIWLKKSGIVFVHGFYHVLLLTFERICFRHLKARIPKPMAIGGKESRRRSFDDVQLVKPPRRLRHTQGYIVIQKCTGSKEIQIRWNENEWAPFHNLNAKRKYSRSSVSVVEDITTIGWAGACS